MAHLIIVQAPEKTYRVLAEHEDRAEARRAARAAVVEASGYKHPFLSDVQPVSLAAGPEFAPDHDLWIGPEEEADVGSLTLTVGFRDVVVLTLPDGSTAKVFLHDVVGRTRAMVRVEAPKTIGVRARKIAEVEA